MKARAIPILLLLLLVLGPISVSGQRRLLITVSVSLKASEAGDIVSMTGKVTDSFGVPVATVLVSIQVENPLRSSVHVALTFTAVDGTFEDQFTLPADAPPGNYTISVTANKPGFDTEERQIMFSYVSADFSLAIRPLVGSVQQGESFDYSVDITALPRFATVVRLSVTELPPVVSHRFSNSSVNPPARVKLTLATSGDTSEGKYNFTVVAVGGARVHRVSATLTVTAAGLNLGQPSLPNLAVFALVPIFIGVAAVAAYRVMKSRRGESVEKFLSEAQLDKGYVATARALARLEELKALGKIDEGTYQRVKTELERRLAG